MSLETALPTCRLGTVHQVAALTGLSSRTVFRHADAGLLPWGCKIGGLRKWDLNQIERWIADGCKPVRR